MTLGEFLNHLKHKSLKNEVSYLNLDRDIKLYKGTIGEYQTAVVKSDINDKSVCMIFPVKHDELEIYIKGEQ